MALLNSLIWHTGQHEEIYCLSGKKSLPNGGNLVVVCNSTGATGSVVFNGVKLGGVYVA